MKVTIPLSLEVEIDLSQIDVCERADTVIRAKIAESAADSLVTCEGLSAPNKVTDRVFVDGHGFVRVTYDVADIALAGRPAVVRFSGETLASGRAHFARKPKDVS